ncbi:MAG: GNAT family N-acetyltransferase [Acidimicrobiia bacterium]
MEITTRPIVAEETVPFREAIVSGFGEDLDDEAFPPGWFDDLVPLDRTVAAFEGDRIVGTLGAFPFHVTVPGGASIAMAGTTIVTVAATHRRRGVLTSMMRDHLEDGRRRGEPLAGLWASESLIYGRYGFGVATENNAIEIDQNRVSVGGDAGSVRLVTTEEAIKLFPAVYEMERVGRPGMLSRTDMWWKHHFDDPSAGRQGFSALRCALHETNGHADGYAVYRQKPNWESGFPDGKISIRELIAPAAFAHTGLWRYLTSIDLFPQVEYWNLPVDDPLAWKVPDHRRIKRKRWDALYVRILDVVQALEARTYAVDGVVRLTIDDPSLPDVGGSFELAVTEGIGSCRRVDDATTDVRLGTTDLASLYLGGNGAAALARAERIRGAEESIVLLGRMFRGDVAPWCEEVF